MVIFDEGEGVIVNKETGGKTRFTMNENGIYELNIWVSKSPAAAGFTQQEK